jgi:hypothetical protein
VMLRGALRRAHPMTLVRSFAEGGTICSSEGIGQFPLE